MECLEIFNKDGSFTGKTADRTIVHKKGLWHRVVHLWIYNDGGEILIQKRSKNKDAHPELWDISAAGHIDINESPETAIIREAKEELGVDIDRNRLEFFDIININLADEKHGIIDNEITYVFLYNFNSKKDIENFKIDPDEVMEIRFVKLEELKEKLKNPTTKMDFVPFDDSYYFPIIDYLLKKDSL